MSDPWSELGGRRPVKAAPKSPAPVKVGRRPQYAGCEHTDDPSGWIYDDESGEILARCPCWSNPESLDNQGRNDAAEA